MVGIWRINGDSRRREDRSSEVRSENYNDTEWYPYLLYIADEVIEKLVNCTIFEQNRRWRKMTLFSIVIMYNLNFVYILTTNYSMYIRARNLYLRRHRMYIIQYTVDANSLQGLHRQLLAPTKLKHHEAETTTVPMTMICRIVIYSS